jgi:hypothetical protein
VANILHLVANMLKGLLDLVSLAFFIFGDGLQVKGGSSRPVVVIRYLFPPYRVVW